MITSSRARLSPFLARSDHFGVALGPQHIFHFHGFDHGQGIAGLDLCPSSTDTAVTSPGIGHSNRREVSGAGFNGIIAASLAA